MAPVRFQNSKFRGMGSEILFPAPPPGFRCVLGKKKAGKNSSVAQGQSTTAGAADAGTESGAADGEAEGQQEGGGSLAPS
jgi:hypothetical protein